MITKKFVNPLGRLITLFLAKPVPGTNAFWEHPTCWVSTVTRGRVEVFMGGSGRDGVPREQCGGGGGEC